MKPRALGHSEIFLGGGFKGVVGNMLGSQHRFSTVTYLNIGIPQDCDHFYNTRLCKGISHLHLEILWHVMIWSCEKYCRVDLT